MNWNDTPEYRVGSEIAYYSFGGDLRYVKVVNRESNIKNGEPGFDGELLHSDEQYEVWGYDSQISHVVKF